MLLDRSRLRLDRLQSNAQTASRRPVAGRPAMRRPRGTAHHGNPMSSWCPAFLHPGLFRHRDGVVPNLLAFAYAFGGYAAGWWLITRGAIVPAVAGTVLLAHAMVIAAYLVHECAHNTVFRDNALQRARRRGAAVALRRLLRQLRGPAPQALSPPRGPRRRGGLQLPHALAAPPVAAARAAGAGVAVHPRRRPADALAGAGASLRDALAQGPAPPRRRGAAGARHAVRARGPRTRPRPSPATRSPTC